MEGLLRRHVDLRAVRKIGEGTFGEAFCAGDGAVLKIVPMEGTLLVNGEPQKRAHEILAEVAIALTLSQLHPYEGACSHLSTLSALCLTAVGCSRVDRLRLGSLSNVVHPRTRYAHLLGCLHPT
jgi:serine/threonine-protein kinase haspin